MNVFLRRPLLRESPDGVRAHPWTSCCYAQGEYYDFKKQPELIPKVLEDFRPWEHYSSVQRFYKLLEWLNGPNSSLETNDSAFRGPHPNTGSTNFKKNMQCHMRLMLFYRHLIKNVRRQHIEWLTLQVESELRGVQIDSSVAKSHCIEVAIIESGYKALNYLSDEEKIGWELDLTAWAFGDSEDETMSSLGAVVDGLHEGLQRVADTVNRR